MKVYILLIAVVAVACTPAPKPPVYRSSPPVYDDHKSHKPSIPLSSPPPAGKTEKQKAIEAELDKIEKLLDRSKEESVP